jgi:nucleoside-diphosphate-sugar epimerase
MKVLVAGASGAIGQPIIAELIRQGHTVTGIARSTGRLDGLAKLGANILSLDVFDGNAVDQALRDSQPEAVIDELTSLPADPADLPKSLPGDRRLRIVGGGNLLRAAIAAGVRRYLQQSSGFFLEPGEGLATESAGFATGASPDVAFSSKSYQELEQRLFSSPLEGVALRYGFFYGPGTWYRRDGAGADQFRRSEVPIVGEGGAVWSWVHIDDAAAGTVAALTAQPGIYNLVDDDPSTTSTWAPAFAKFVDAPPPPHISEEQALTAAGPDAVYYGTRLRGASNEKAKKTLNFRPRRLEWLS